MSANITDWLKFNQNRKNGTANAINRCQLVRSDFKTIFGSFLDQKCLNHIYHRKLTEAKPENQAQMVHLPDGGHTLWEAVHRQYN